MEAEAEVNCGKYSIVSTVEAARMAWSVSSITTSRCKPIAQQGSSFEQNPNIRCNKKRRTKKKRRASSCSKRSQSSIRPSLKGLLVRRVPIKRVRTVRWPQATRGDNSMCGREVFRDEPVCGEGSRGAGDVQPSSESNGSPQKERKANDLISM